MGFGTGGVGTTQQTSAYPSLTASGGNPTSQTQQGYGLGGDAMSRVPQREVPVLIPAIPQAAGVRGATDSGVGSQNRGMLAVALLAVGISGLAFAGAPILIELFSNKRFAAARKYHDEHNRDSRHITIQTGDDRATRAAMKFFENYAQADVRQRMANYIYDSEARNIELHRAAYNAKLGGSAKAAIRKHAPEIIDQPLGLLGLSKQRQNQILAAIDHKQDVALKPAIDHKIFKHFGHADTENVSPEQIRNGYKWIQGYFDRHAHLAEFPLSSKSGKLSDYVDIQQYLTSIRPFFEEGFDATKAMGGLGASRGPKAQEWIVNTHRKAVADVRRELGVVR